MSAIDKIKAKAKSKVMHIVLPEGTEPRTVQATRKITDQGIAKVTLLGNVNEVKKVAAETGTDLTGVDIIDPKTSEKSAGYADLLYELRKAKGMTPEQAAELVTGNTLYFGAVMLKAGDADGMVAGAINSTGNVLRPALQIIKTAPGIKVVSSCFIMEIPDHKWGDDGVMIFGDCAVIPNPTADEMAAIAVASAGTAKKLLASSALYCYCAALDKALETRSAKYRRIEGKATVRTGTDDKGRGRVTGIDLDVTVFMDQEYEFIFDRVEKIMKQGCLITGSLEAAFPVKYNLNLECDED